MGFKLTLDYLYRKYDEFNAEYFDGKLPGCTIKLMRSRTLLGQWKGRERCLRISTYCERDEAGFCNTLIHEMIHQWQWEIFRNVNHGQTFKMKAAEINRYGWDVKRCGGMCENTVGPLETRTVIFYTYHGVRYFTSVCEKSVQTILDIYGNCISDVEVKKVTGRFTHIPRCTKTLRGYLMSKFDNYGLKVA